MKKYKRVRDQEAFTKVGELRLSSGEKLEVIVSDAESDRVVDVEGGLHLSIENTQNRYFQQPG